MVLYVADLEELYMDSSIKDIVSIILTLFTTLSLMFVSFICENSSIKSMVYALIIGSIIIVKENIKEIKNK